MRKTVFVLVMCIALLAAAVALADGTTADGLVYRIEDGAAIIYDYMGSSGVVVVPAMLEGVPVTVVNFWNTETGRKEHPEITAIDVSHNPNLERLHCAYTNITNLDVSHNPNLESLNCASTNITSMDVSYNPNLEVFSCNSNSIKSLDVSHNPNLKELSCALTNIMNLDVSHNLNLELLFCYSTNITSLDVSHNLFLRWLWCDYTSITSLDVSHNSELNDLWCSGISYPITTRTLDLTTLPGNFDPAKASNWQGGSVNGNTLTVTSDTVTYDYDCGQGYTATFTLTYDPSTPALPGDADGDGSITLADALAWLTGTSGTVDVQQAVEVLRQLCQ